jgi:ribosome-binding protein aMBF1 (putative translation factor)
MECEICGSDERLVEAIGEEKILRVCETCVKQNNFPVIRKPSINQIRDIDRYQSVKERLGVQAGIDLKKHENKEVDKELEKFVVENLEAGEREDLVENFHWVIQGGRRRKKISQKQLAEAIAEPEILIEMAEKSKLPDNYAKLIGKLEQFLGIKLWKDKREIKGEVNLRKVDWSATKIGDLKNIHDEKFSNEEKEKKQNLLDDVAKKLEGKRKSKGFWKGEEDFE